jgi:hypothetical protein
VKTLNTASYAVLKGVVSYSAQSFILSADCVRVKQISARRGRWESSGYVLPNESSVSDWPKALLLKHLETAILSPQSNIRAEDISEALLRLEGKTETEVIENIPLYLASLRPYGGAGCGELFSPREKRVCALHISQVFLDG